MGIIGIACNPQSGKDIRRLLTAATTIDDMEKLNILERILLSAAAVGEQKVYLMPDRLGYGRLLLQKRNSPGYPGDLSQLEVYDMDRTETQSDTVFFASEMERIGADVLIVMGGDGTSRAAAKGTRKVPMLSMSTGTNNVYPELMEGTAAEFTDGPPNTLAPVGAGTVRGVHIQNVRRLALGEPLTRVMDYQGTLALDGEREIFFRPGDEITCAVTRNGPLRVDARRAIEYARTHGCFQL